MTGHNTATDSGKEDLEQTSTTVRRTQSPKREGVARDKAGRELSMEMVTPELAA